MMIKLLSKIYDNRQSDSLAAHLRKKRVALFRSLTISIPGPLRILDVGGNQLFWETVGCLEQVEKDLEITLINIKQSQVTHPNFKSITGDARNMQQFEDNEFDIVFSNAVIEHVGTFNDQLRMANEIRRVGKRYFLQTPNLYFPIESHFLFPFFQFLPLQIRVWLVSNFNLGWEKRATDKQKAIELVNSIRLLSKKQLISLFPSANILEEKVFGLTKSFIVYDGWNTAFSLSNQTREA